MTFLRREIESLKTLSSDDATHIVKLPRRGALSALMLRCQMTNGATSGRAVSMLDVVDSVEVLANGDRPIISLNSDELLRWQRFWTRQFAQLEIDEQASAVQYWYMPLLFGLGVGDRSHFLPLDQFSDLELRVKYSPPIAADGGFATGTFRILTVGYLKDNTNGLSFQGFFRTLNKYNFTSVASGDEEIELPRGNPYRAIMVYAHESGVAMDTDISDIKLELDDGALIWGDWSTYDLVRENHAALGLKPEYHGTVFGQGTETIETYLDYLKSVSIQPGDVATIGTTDTPHAFLSSVTGGLITPQTLTIEGSGTWSANAALAADYDWRVSAVGLGLGKAAIIDFTDGIVANDVFSSDNYSKVKLVLTNAGAGAQVRVSLSELVQGV